MTNKLFLCKLVMIITIFALCSCENETESFTPSKSNSSHVENLLITTNNYQELNVIPDSIIQKMSDEELQVWKKLSSQFYIDYSFIDTKYYKLCKNTFLQRMVKLYNTAIEKKEETAKLSFIPISLESYKMTRFSAIDDTTNISNGNINESDSIDIDEPIYGQSAICQEVKEFSVGGATIVLRCSGIITLSGTISNPIITWSDLSYNFIVKNNPNSAYNPSFSGYIDMEPIGNEVKITGKGRITYRSYSTNIVVNNYIGVTL